MFISSISWIMRLTILPTIRTKTFKPLDAAMAAERLIPNSMSALSARAHNQNFLAFQVAQQIDG
jgi:hypothetical protein